MLRDSLLTLALILLNFPAAAAAGLISMTVYAVQVSNQSDTVLSAVRVYGGGVDLNLGTVQSGKTARKLFWVKHDGELVLTAKHGSRQVQQTIDGYVTHGMGGTNFVRVKGDGTIECSPPGTD